ncbi:MAG: Polysaccharide deacetylase [Candidatus Ozemobacter sibiricus]|jgi:peptidoglycan/xylan/chitin deacetylase (PgdA/CDA1 family)|uniref:Polysaccharide deacetylase n=1 Tax=Candidatus Ozemobacter sibiricus TaxID=2268124 RepID=A0A367ZN15_9BACT|nr:MAG: Polysaccharide deacetylase [Candidatus Ozemobacter sibiricus]
MTRSIPVLYYHRIGAPDPLHLSIPTALFDRQIGFLIRRGFRGITLGQLLRHLAGTAPVNHPTFVVTFDDGFRDNLTEAWPVLRRHRCPATIFMVGRLIRPPDQPPSSMPRDFNAAHRAACQGDLSDFLSRQEMQEMHASGLIEFHSHSLSHRQVFTGCTLTGVYPDTDAHWGVLSAYGAGLPERSWPVFPRAPGLTAPAWEPDLGRLQAAGRDWSREWQEWQAGRGKTVPAVPAEWFRIESTAAYERRVREELAASRALFQGFHEPGTDLICWPWGAFTPAVVQWAREEGYHGALTTASGPTLPGGDPFAIPRYPVKKGDLARFALGIWLRTSPTLARVYGVIRRWGRPRGT